MRKRSFVWPPGILVDCRVLSDWAVGCTPRILSPVIQFSGFHLKCQNVKYKFPGVFAFIFFVHQFTGVKCFLGRCPGLCLKKWFDDTWQIRCFQKRVTDTRVAAAAGSPLTVTLGPSRKFREGGGQGVTRAVGRRWLAPAPSLNPEENKRIHEMKRAAIVDVKIPRSFTALGALPASVSWTESSF